MNRRDEDELAIDSRGATVTLVRNDGGDTYEMTTSGLLRASPAGARGPVTTPDRCDLCYFGHPENLVPGAVPTGHVEAHVEVDGRCAGVDEEITPLVSALWRLGVVTTDSCQDDPKRDGFSRIGLTDMLDAARMAEALTGGPEEWVDVDFEWTVEDEFGHRVLHGWDWKALPMPYWDDEKDVRAEAFWPPPMARTGRRSPRRSWTSQSSSTNFSDRPSLPDGGGWLTPMRFR